MGDLRTCIVAQVVLMYYSILVHKYYFVTILIKSYCNCNIVRKPSQTKFSSPQPVENVENVETKIDFPLFHNFFHKKIYFYFFQNFSQILNSQKFAISRN